MKSKIFEIRDDGTFIPILATKLDPSNEQERYLLARAGYGRSPEEQRGYVILSEIAGGHGRSSCDPYEWTGSRTIARAHQYIDEAFDTLEHGALIDIEFLEGESFEPKLSESFTAHL